MSLEKAIEHKKEHRKPYKLAKSVSKQCRNHGNCKWCENNRTYNARKKASFMFGNVEIIDDGNYVNYIWRGE